MRRALAAALSTCTSLAAPVAADDRALVVGINDYSALEGSPALTGAVQDADAVVAALTGPMGFAPDQITLLLDGAARHDAILTAIIDRLIAETRPGDRVVFYFAGHGMVLDEGTPGLVAADGDTVLGRIPLETLANIFSHVADREVTIVLDTGFAAGPPGTRGLGATQPAGVVELGADFALWTAATPGTHAWEDGTGGALTQAWIAGLTTEATDSNGDLAITQMELSNAVTAALESWCTAHAGCAAAGAGLAPQISGAADQVVARLSAPAPPPAPILDPILEDDGLPASYRETLGFVTDLFSPSNDAGLSLSIPGGESLQVGDLVTFQATVERAGALLLLDLDPSGALVQVYPSRLSADGATQMEPGQSLVIPNALGASGRPLRMRVTEPAGQGLLLGLFIEGALDDLTAVMPAGLAGGPVPGGNQSLFEISQNLLRMEADPDRPIRWSATYLPYRIDP